MVNFDETTATRSIGHPIHQDYLTAIDVLTALVREEYPADQSISEIARTWTPDGITPSQLDALDRVLAWPTVQIVQQWPWAPVNG